MKSAPFKIIEARPTAISLDAHWGRWQKGTSERNIRLNHHMAVVVGVQGNSKCNGTEREHTVCGGSADLQSG